MPMKLSIAVAQRNVSEAMVVEWLHEGGARAGVWGAGDSAGRLYVVAGGPA